MSVPRTLRLAVGIGFIELVGLVAFVIGIALSAGATRGWRADVSPGKVAIAEIVTYIVFAIGLALIVHFLRLGRPASRAPFVLAQLLLIAVANILRTGDQPWAGIGIALIVLSVTAIVLVFTPAARAVLDR